MISLAKLIRRNGNCIGTYRWGNAIDTEVFADSGRLYYIAGERVVGETDDSPPNRAVITK
jgi:hypothetical protein